MNDTHFYITLLADADWRHKAVVREMVYARDYTLENVVADYETWREIYDRKPTP